MTHKNELESIDETVLAQTANQLRDALGLCGSTSLGMDWSLRHGLEVEKLPEDDGREAVDFPSFIVVHGAG